MIGKQISENDARSRLAALCAQGEHCSYEMTVKMRRWELAEDAQERIIQYLVTNRFIDDERYARAMAIDKLRHNKWGRKKIEQAMWLKHIDNDISTRILDEIDDEEYIDILRPLLKAKRRSIKASSDYELYKKLVRFAMSRGYDYRLIRICLGDIDVCDEDEFE